MVGFIIEIPIPLVPIAQSIYKYYIKKKREKFENYLIDLITNELKADYNAFDILYEIFIDEYKKNLEITKLQETNSEELIQEINKSKKKWFITWKKNIIGKVKENFKKDFYAFYRYILGFKLIDKLTTEKEFNDPFKKISSKINTIEEDYFIDFLYPEHMRKEDFKRINSYIQFRTAPIPQSEADILQEIEELLELKFTNVENLKLYFMEHTKRDMMIFTWKEQRVIGIGINKVEISTLPESIMKLKSLQELILNRNQLKTLPESISNLKSLTTLKLELNKLKTLPESISNLTSLLELDIRWNNLKTLPESIGNLKSLTYFNLIDNFLTTLPESITKLESLEELHLSSNQLTTLPESIGNLTSLQELSLSGNRLTTLPESISNLTSLQKLDLYKNLFTTLPESIGNLESLQYLDIKKNQLTALPEVINILVERGVKVSYDNWPVD